MHEPALLLFDQVGGSELFCAWWAAKKMGASAEQLCLKSRVSNHPSGWAGGNTSESTFTSLFKVGLVLRADSCFVSPAVSVTCGTLPRPPSTDLRGDQLTSPHAKAGDKPMWDQGNLRLATRKELRFQS